VRRDLRRHEHPGRLRQPCPLQLAGDLNARQRTSAMSEEPERAVQIRRQEFQQTPGQLTVGTVVRITKTVLPRGRLKSGRSRYRRLGVASFDTSSLRNPGRESRTAARPRQGQAAARSIVVEQQQKPYEKANRAAYKPARSSWLLARTGAWPPGPGRGGGKRDDPRR
jgi:hypothetical protein